VKDTEEKDDGGFNFRTMKAVTILVGLVFLKGIFAVSLRGQNGDMQRKMADLKDSMAKNKQRLWRNIHGTNR
jgi:hypothetical protein